MIVSRHTSKPEAGTPIDASSPLAQGLLCFLPFNEVGGVVAENAFNSGTFAFVGTPSWSNGPAAGRVLSVAPSSSGVRLNPVPTPLQSAFPMTLAVRVMWMGASGTSTTTPLVTTRFRTGNLAAQIGLNPNNGATQARSAGGQAGTGFTLTANVWYTIVQVTTASGLEFFVNGASVYSNSTSNSALSWNSTGYLTAGWNSSIGASTLNSVLDFAGWWRRALTLADIEQLTENPWQMFTTSASRYFHFIPSSAAFSPYWAPQQQAVIGSGVY